MLLYTSAPGEFTLQEETLLEVWCLMKEPGPGDYTIAARSPSPLLIYIDDDKNITRQ